jgi:Flp pilus assembly protein TadG
VTHRAGGDRGAGLLSTAAGVVVFLVFLLFAVQLLFGLYASSTVTAVANDAATRAASAEAPPLSIIEAEARANLGEVGRTATFAWDLADTDGDGGMDTVVLEVVARPPRFIPPSIGGSIGLDEIRRVVRVRAEQVSP